MTSGFIAWRPRQKTAQELLDATTRRAQMTHEASFYVSLAFSVFFYWGLGGGKIVWNILFACLGLVIDFTKRSELELSSFERDFWIRNRRRFFALVLTSVSILAALSASLTRAASVARTEQVASNTDGEKLRVANAQKNVTIWQDVISGLPFNYATERTKAADRLAVAQAELANAQAELDRKSAAGAGKELRIDTFAELAAFFGVANYQTFMVLLLMVGAIGAELSFWLTLTPHWRNQPEAETPKSLDLVLGNTNAIEAAKLRAGMIAADELFSAPPVSSVKEPIAKEEKTSPRVDTLF